MYDHALGGGDDYSCPAGWEQKTTAFALRVVSEFAAILRIWMTTAFQKSVNAFIRQGQYYGDVTWLLDYAEVLVMPRAANQGRNLAEGLQTTKRALSHSRCHEECLERLSVAWKTTKGSESDAARRLIRRSENGRLTLAAPYAERLQTQIPTTKSRSEANASSS